MTNQRFSGVRILKMAKRNKKNLAESIRLRFAPFGGVELELPKRDPGAPVRPKKGRLQSQDLSRSDGRTP